MPKRIDSSGQAAVARVSLADLAAAPSTGTADRSPPNKMRKSRPGPEGPPKKKRTFWRKLWIGMQIARPWRPG